MLSQRVKSEKNTQKKQKNTCLDPRSRFQLFFFSLHAYYETIITVINPNPLYSKKKISKYYLYI